MSKLYDLLAEVEKKNNVHIIYAAEAGSREWSIDSRDSDYNERFVFVRKNFKSYLSLNKTAKLESLEGSSRGRLIDYRGYDISKALRGLSQLNPSLVELIYSSTVYKQDEKRTFVDQVRRVLDSQHRLVPLLDHYRSMAKYYYKNEIETQQNVSLRNYFYVIRPVLMLEWSAHKHHLKATMNDKDKKNSTTGVGHVKLMETNFTLMFNDLKGVMKDEVHAAVMTLLDKKKRSKRTRTVERVKCVDEWIESALADYAKLFARIRDQSATKQQQQQKEQKPNQSSNDVDLHKFDPILHSVLKVKFDDDEQEDRDSWDPDYLDWSIIKRFHIADRIHITPLTNLFYNRTHYIILYLYLMILTLTQIHYNLQ